MKKSSTQSSAVRIFVLFKKLSRFQKLQIVNRLEKEIREARWDLLTSRLSSRLRNNPVSDEEITRIVEDARQERYERSQGRS